MLPQLLDTFAEELEADFERTLNRFLALQVHGSRDAGEVLRRLRSGMLRRGRPDPAALRAGLEILRNTDLRAACATVDCPALLIGGERDTLVPAAAVTATAALLPQARLHMVDGGGHAPFLSAPGEVAGVVHDFLLPAGAARMVDGNG
jgi:pimeloyl-[acyl-carrier protein] methyl ester esterase